jgi:hypothetical protein
MTMNILDFTAEEASLIAIYAENTRAATLATMTAALPDMDVEFADIAAQSAAKLAAMSDEDFAEAVFALADEDDPEPNDAA